MSEDIPDPSSQALLNCAYLDLLEPAFPNISRFPIDVSFLGDPALRKLISLLKFGIPVHTYQPDPLALYDRISQIYYDYLFRHSLKVKEMPDHHHVSFQPPPQVEAATTVPQSTEKLPSRKKINYLDLARFIQSFTPEMEGSVNQEVIRQGQRFDSWQRKEVTVAAFKETPKKPREKYEKYERAEFTFKEKVLKADNTINITIGKNISREVHEMKKLLIKRAENNRLLQDNLILTDLQKVEAEINFILNRITEEYFEQFLDELHPYAMHELYSLVLAEKIIEKILEEHNFIKLYSKLIKRLRKVNVEYGDRGVMFKVIFIEKLQISFYKLIRKREWTDREQLYKKQLLGFSFFVGQLIYCNILSKFAFPDIFFELISSFIHQYRQYEGNKNFYYYETYVECIIKIIESMGDKYDGLLSKATLTNVHTVCETILATFDDEEANFQQVCDFIEVLKELNKRMPSQRFKISFLLEDFRCSKALQREVSKEENNEYEIVKSALAIDHSNAHDVRKIPGMIAVCDPRIIMKDYYFQFAQGNAKHVAKNLETFKMFMDLPGMLDAALSALKENLSGLYMIDSDFPFLAEGLAKIMKQVCDYRRCEWRELQLSDPDEDIGEFIERIENKYFKMILED